MRDQGMRDLAANAASGADDEGYLLRSVRRIDRVHGWHGSIV